jgi:hypothetical protein
MKVWDSIESLAEDKGISERTGWRWLRRGKIRKVRGEDGEFGFALADDTDMSLTTDTDRENNVAVTRHNVIKSVTTDKRKGDRKMAENRTSVGLECLEGIQALKEFTDGVIAKVPGKIHGEIEKAINKFGDKAKQRLNENEVCQNALEPWVELQKTLAGAYKTIESESFGVGDLKKIWGDLLKMKSISSGDETVEEMFDGVLGKLKTLIVLTVE